MRKLAWFSGGFAGACLLSCYTTAGSTAAVVCLLFFVAAWLIQSCAQPQKQESPDLSLLPVRRRRVFQIFRRSAVLFLGAALAFGWFQGYSALFYRPGQTFAGTERTISGVVTSYPEETSIGGQSMTVRLDGGFRSPDVLLYGSADWSGLEPGDRVTCTARLKSSEFLYGDETTYYTARGLFLLAYCNDPPVVEKANSIPFRYWPDLCAKALKNGIYAAFDSAAAPLAAAVTLGDKDGLSQQTYSALSRSGIMHAAVVSGMHISFLVSVLLLLCGGRRRAALALVPVLVFYALMAGSTPSAFRAVIMQTALLAGPLLSRENDPPSSLGLALLILLIQNPFAAASVSLQLSFASVAGILLVSHRLNRALLTPVRARLKGTGAVRRCLYGLCRFVAASLSVTLGAMLFTVPLNVIYFRQIGLISPLTNILTLWAVTALMICALIIGTLAIFLPQLMIIPGTLTGLLGHYVLAVTSLIGRLPLASLPGDNPYFLIWLMAAYLFLFTIVLSRRKGRQAVYSLVCLALLLVFSVGLNRRAVRQYDLTVSALDVGQGSSTLFLSGRNAVLVDCGGNSQADPGDLAADILAATGTARLNALVLTHLDNDHFNGVPQLFWRLDVEQVFLPVTASDPENLALLLDLAEAENCAVTFVTESKTLSAGSAAVTLYPPLVSGSSNDGGLFVLCSADGFDTLITGDADSFTENLLLKYYSIPDLELLVAGHHGSKYSTSAALLDALRPELAIISAGYNSYGHPAPETLERLNSAGAEVFRTDLLGTVTLKVQNGEVFIP